MKAIVATQYGSPEVFQFKELIETGRLKSVLDRCSPLEQIVEAQR